jgi:hypothetical protein
MARWLAFSLAVLALPAAAVAEQRSEAERQAEQAFQRGTRLFEAEDFLGAAREFEEAYQISPIASVHFNIARSYELAEMPELAAQHYRAFLDARAGNPERRQTVRQRLDALSQGLGWVSVTTEPAGATLLLDGQERGISPATLAATPGRHTIDARREGQSATRTVDVGDAELAVSLRLAAEPDQTPRVSGDDYEPRPDGHHEEAPQPEGSTPAQGGEDHHGVRRLHHGFFWAGLGLSVASGIALGVVGARLIEAQDEYDAVLRQVPRDEEREQELIDEGTALEVDTTALWIVTGVVVGATVLFAIFTDWGRLRRHRGDAAWARFGRF